MPDDDRNAASPKVKALRERYAAEMARMAVKVVKLLERESSKLLELKPLKILTSSPERPPPRRDGFQWWDRGAPPPGPPRRDKHPYEFHSAFVEAQPPSNWIRDGGQLSGRSRGSWINRGR